MNLNPRAVGETTFKQIVAAWPGSYAGLDPAPLLKGVFTWKTVGRPPGHPDVWLRRGGVFDGGSGKARSWRAGELGQAAPPRTPSRRAAGAVDRRRPAVSIGTTLRDCPFARVHRNLWCGAAVHLCHRPPGPIRAARRCDRQDADRRREFVLRRRGRVPLRIEQPRGGRAAPALLDAPRKIEEVLDRGHLLEGVPAGAILVVDGFPWDTFGGGDYFYCYHTGTRLKGVVASREWGAGQQRRAAHPAGRRRKAGFPARALRRT